MRRRFCIQNRFILGSTSSECNPQMLKPVLDDAQLVMVLWSLRNRLFKQMLNMNDSQVFTKIIVLKQLNRTFRYMRRHFCMRNKFALGFKSSECNPQMLKQAFFGCICDMIKRNESLVENFNSYFLAPLSRNLCYVTNVSNV